MSKILGGRLVWAVPGLSRDEGKSMPRPTEIIWFERIIIGTLIVGVFKAFLDWPRLAAAGGTAFSLSILSFTLALMLALTLLVSRRRSSVAKWLMIGLFALGLPAFFQLAAAGQVHGSLLITVAQLIGQLVAYALLFTPAARRWFRGGAEVA